MRTPILLSILGLFSGSCFAGQSPTYSENARPWNWVNAYFDVDKKEGEVLRRAQDVLGKWAQGEDRLDPATSRRDREREDFIKRHGARFLEKRALKEIDDYTTISKTWGGNKSTNGQVYVEADQNTRDNKNLVSVTTSLSSSRGRVSLDTSIFDVSATIFRNGNAEARLEPEITWLGLQTYYQFDLRDRAGHAVFERSLTRSIGLRTTITNSFRPEKKDDQRFEFIFGRDF